MRMLSIAGIIAVLLLSGCTQVREAPSCVGTPFALNAGAIAAAPGGYVP